MTVMIFITDFECVAKSEFKRDAANRLQCTYESHREDSVLDVHLFGEETKDGKTYIFVFVHERGRFAYLDRYEN